MIHKLFGVVDIVVALMLYFGDVPGPQFLASAVIILLIAKGAVSLVYFPFIYIPGLVMGLTDVFAVVLLFFSAVPLSPLKGILIIVILIKALPALLMDIAKIVG